MGFSLKLDVTLKSLNIIVRDNNIIDALKDLQHHVNYYNGALEHQHGLKEKVLDHIKINFMRLLANDNALTNIIGGRTDPNSLISGNHDPKVTLSDYIKLIVDRKESDAPPKLLLCLSLEEVSVDFNMEARSQILTLTMDRIVGLDLLGVNNEVKTILHIKDQSCIKFRSNSIRKSKKRVINYFNHTSYITLDDNKKYGSLGTRRH